VLVDSNLGVSQNVIVGGGMHVEGELTVNHITAPEEIQETEQTTLYATTVTGKIIGYAKHPSHHGGGDEWFAVYGGSSTGGTATQDCIQCYGHTHQFKNVPLHLMKTSSDVRKVAKKLEKPYKAPASPVEHENKGGGLTSKGESIS
jgi:hypothetical protein